MAGLTTTEFQEIILYRMRDELELTMRITEVAKSGIVSSRGASLRQILPPSLPKPEGAAQDQDLQVSQLC